MTARSFFLCVICIALFTGITAYRPGAAHRLPATYTDTIPALLRGDFTDDYGIRYSITDSVWVQHPNIKYHILRWNHTEQYLVARNDAKNPTEPGLYTRIDYMIFSNMEPWRWGFCLTVYNAPDDSTAANARPADRVNPRKGCNGYPFSRMKQHE